MPDAEKTRPDRHEFAGWGRRLAAALLDSAILAAVVLATLLLAGLPFDEVEATIREGSSLALIVLFVLPRPSTTPR